MNQNRKLPVSFHPLGLVAISLAAGGVVVWRYLAGDWSPLRFQIALTWVAFWMTVQLILDYRHTEQWFVKMTTPPFGLSLRELWQFRWPFIVCGVVGVGLGALVWGLMVASLIVYVPWQSRMYARSREVLKALASDSASGA